MGGGSEGNLVHDSSDGVCGCGGCCVCRGYRLCLVEQMSWEVYVWLIALRFRLSGCDNGCVLVGSSLGMVVIS